MMSVTLFDVGGSWGIESTVSLVINNSNAVKPETKARVYDAIKKLIMYPMFLHVNLQLRKTGTWRNFPYKKSLRRHLLI